MRGVRFGASGSKQRERSEPEKVESLLEAAHYSVGLIAVRNYKVAAVLAYGGIDDELGSSTFDGSKGSVNTAPSRSAKMRLRLFALLPMIKYAPTAYLPSSLSPAIMPLPT